MRWEKVRQEKINKQIEIEDNKFKNPELDFVSSESECHSSVADEEDTFQVEDSLLNMEENSAKSSLSRSVSPLMKNLKKRAEGSALRHVPGRKKHQMAGKKKKNRKKSRMRQKRS
jgi:hypothetical protein